MTQLELKYYDALGNGDDGSAWTHKFTLDTLTVDADRWKLAFGLWNKFHGAWITDRETGKSREIIPDWIPLNELGTYGTHPRPFHKGDFYPFPRNQYAKCKISSAFVAYFDQIPARIRRVVGQLRGHQWLALDLIWQVPEFAWFLDAEITDGRRHYFHACVELSGVERMSRSARRQFAISLMSRRRADFLSGLTGAQHTKKSCRLFAKMLGDEPWPTKSYKEILDIAGTKTGSKALCHAELIDFLGISLWLNLPALLQISNLLRLFVTDSYASMHFVAEIEAIFPRLSDGTLKRVRSSLVTVSDHWTLSTWVDRNLESYLKELPFPKPPVTGNENLLPLSSSDSMRREALSMRNCLDGEIRSVRAGARYYYHWSGSEDATILLEQNSENDWYFSQVLGLGNEPVSKQTRLYVEAVVEAQLSCKKQNLHFQGLIRDVQLANDNASGPADCEALGRLDDPPYSCSAPAQSK